MNRVERLEERVAHLMKTLEEVSDVVAGQAEKIDRLERLVRLLAEREAAREAALDPPDPNVRPPHW